jgi:hypothetical protein
LRLFSIFLSLNKKRFLFWRRFAVKDEDWNNIRASSQAAASASAEEKSDFDLEIENIRLQLNKLTDKNYVDILNKIFDSINKLITNNTSSEEMSKLSTIIFELATNNRFYSKIYADLYSELITKYKEIKDTFEKNFNSFTELFANIEYIDANVNYDKFCENNKKNEKRRSLAAFYVNLMTNNVISKVQLMTITRDLLAQIYEFISIENKKNEVDELTETISILYKKEIYEDDEGDDYDSYDKNQGLDIFYGTGYDEDVHSVFDFIYNGHTDRGYSWQHKQEYDESLM